MTGIIFDIKEMAVHDGPGIRTTVFLKGCPLRCLWCHNPEGLSPKPQLMYKNVRCKGCERCKTECDHPECQPFGRCVHLCPENCLEISGKSLSAKQLADDLLSSAKAFGNGFGGFTFSGGEPLMQDEFLLETAQYLKGHHLCIETSGYASFSVFKRVVDALDFIIMDIKLYNDEMHKKYTGVSNKQILENFEYLKQSGKPFIIRTPLISGITDTKENLDAIENLVGDAVWECLPENKMAGAKYAQLGMEFKL